MTPAEVRKLADKFGKFAPKDAFCTLCGDAHTTLPQCYKLARARIEANARRVWFLRAYNLDKLRWAIDALRELRDKAKLEYSKTKESRMSSNPFDPNYKPVVVEQMKKERKAQRKRKLHKNSRRQNDGGGKQKGTP